jgi:hypothetical protein
MRIRKTGVAGVVMIDGLNLHSWSAGDERDPGP